jgi:hypothetical protein
MKAEGARLALVENAAAFVDQVQSVWPTRVGELDSIVETVDKRRKLDAQLAHTRTRNVRAFYFILGAAEQNVVAHIGLHLPHIGRMRLKNVHGVETDLVAVLLRQLVQGGNLPPKRRSSITAEDKDDRPVSPKRRQISGTVVFELLHGQVRSSIADV